jgi:CheY-like chemotaxis protein
VVEETLTMLSATMPATVALRGHVDAGVDSDQLIVEGDMTQIGQVLMNLCVNARDALPEDSGNVWMELTRVDIDGGCAEGLRSVDATPGKAVMRIRSDPDGKHHRMWVGTLAEGGRCAQITVRDSGTGMDRSIMERMFEPFFTTKSIGKGTGLGLAAVHGIVAAHGGAITVESVIGEGTTFRILLPLAANPVAEAVTADRPSASRGRELVLLVDDETEVVAMTTRCLERLGYEVASCEDPVDAWETFAEDPDAWDVVVTDHTMPGLTGLELARRMLERRAGLPIVLCTGYSEAANEETASAIGIAAFLNKPVDPNKLAATLRAVLDRGGAAQTAAPALASSAPV